MLTSEIEAIRSKEKGYAARIATLETDLAQAEQELQALQRDEDRLVDVLTALLQKLTVAEKRVYGSLLDELGVDSLQQLETEMVGKLRENEAMQAECRTHLALLQNKKKYGQERLQSVRRALDEQNAARSKAEKRLRELRTRWENADEGLRELDEQLESVQVAIVNLQRRISEEESRIGVFDARIREVEIAPTCSNVETEPDEEAGRRGIERSLRHHDSAVQTERDSPLRRGGTNRDSAAVRRGRVSLRLQRGQRDGSGVRVARAQPEFLPALHAASGARGGPRRGSSASHRLLEMQPTERRTSPPCASPQISELEFARRDEAFRSRIAQMAAELDRMQPNLLAAQKVRDLTDRVSEMNQSRKRLVAAFHAANEAFQECSRRRSARFREAFELVQTAIDPTYKDLTRSLQFATGGQAVLTLTHPDVGLGGAFHG